MKRLGKIISVVAMLALMTVLFSVVTVSADANIMYFTANVSPDNADGGYYATGVGVSAEGDTGITMDGTGANTPRCLWAFTNSVINEHPYFYFKLKNPENCPKITFTKYWGGAPELEWTELEGEQCINVLEMLKDQDTIGYTYITPYVTIDTTITFEYMYLSDTDPDGNVYTPPTQEPVKKGMEGHMLRYDMPVFTADNTDVEGKPGYQFLMSTGIDCVPDENGKSFILRRTEGAKEAQANIAWVVPDAQLAETPYLVVEFANEGRADEGPQVCVYAYWEHVVGSLAVFDGMGTKYHGANGLHGVNQWNLSYACYHDVKEELHGEDGIAIIMGLNFADARSDGTVLDDLVVKDVYLMGWEAGYEEGGEHYTASTDPTSAPTDPAKPGEPTQAGQYGTKDDGKFPIVPVVIAVVVLVVIVVIVAVVVAKKKK